MRSVEIREKARQLRREGHSLGDIAAQVGVVKSTVSYWVRDIELDDSQILALDEAKRARLRAQNRGAKANRDKFRAMRTAYQQAGRLRARENPTPLHLMGCMLYWAEGAKGRTEVAFVNSDPVMVLIFCRFLKEELSIPDERIVLQVTSHSLDIEVNEKQNQYWRNFLGLPQSCLRKTVYKEGNPKARHRILENGICRIAVHRGEVLQHIYGAIQAYAGIDKPEWLG